MHPRGRRRQSERSRLLLPQHRRRVLRPRRHCRYRSRPSFRCYQRRRKRRRKRMRCHQTPQQSRHLQQPQPQPRSRPGPRAAMFPNHAHNPILFSPEHIQELCTEPRTGSECCAALSAVYESGQLCDVFRIGGCETSFRSHPTSKIVSFDSCRG